MSATRRLVVTLAVVWVAVVAIGSVVIAILPFPPGQASDVSQSISDTTRLITWAAWPVFSGVVVAIAGALLIQRRAPATGRSGTALRGNARLAGIWVGVVGAIVLVLAIVGTITLNNEEAAEALGLPGRGNGGGSSAVGGTSEQTTIEVQVIAQQWAFTYRYPGYGGFESGRLELPVGSTVNFHVTSLDVVHSFWFPALGVKADAVPLHDNTFNAHTNQIGTYRIMCSELCGLWHGNMDDNTVQVVSQSDFGTWAAQQAAADAPVMQYLPPYSPTYKPDPGAYGT